MRVLITGANTEGLGGAVARELAGSAQAAGRNCTLVLCTSGTGPSNLQLADKLRAMGAKVAELHGDLGDPDTPARLVKEAIAFAGGLDGVVANAAIMKPGRLTNLSVEDWDRVFAVDVRSVWLLAKAVYEPLKKSAGAFVGIASTSAFEPYKLGGRLFSCQGGGSHALPPAGGGVGARQHPGQYRVPGCDAHVDESQSRQSRIRRKPAPHDSARSHGPSERSGADCRLPAGSRRELHYR
ncbi:SDR family oxidoreductase [Novosphingobium sp. G106]|nr:SDR family oxidoreductase [Novosphingobium sp. G106]